MGERIRGFIKEGDKPIFTIQISKSELRVFKLIGNHLGFYPQLLIGNHHQT